MEFLKSWILGITAAALAAALKGAAEGLFPTMS